MSSADDTPAEVRVGAEPPTTYEPPQIVTLGTLADLTLGGNASGDPDQFGEAGYSGTI